MKQNSLFQYSDKFEKSHIRIRKGKLKKFYYLINKLFLFSLCSFLLIISTNQSYSQSSIKWVLDEKGASTITENIPEGKALLIFDSPVDLTFDSSIENLVQPAKKSGKYYLFVNSGPQVITIKYFSNYNINFGQITASNTLPSLKNKDIKYFKINEIRSLEWYNITDREIAKGNVGVPLGANVSDALVILNVFPPDLEIQISDENESITKQSKDGSTYKIFLKAPGDHKLIIKHPDFDDTELFTNNLNSKETRFFLIRQPVELTDYQKNEELNIDKTSILGFWGGSLGAEETYLDLQEIESGTDIIKGRLYQNKLFYNVRGVIRIKSKDDFHIILNKTENTESTESGTLDIVFKRGIGSGIWISDNGNIQDYIVMRVQMLPAEETVDTININNLKNLIKGTWTASSNRVFSSIFLNELNGKNKVTGTVKLLNGNSCTLNGVLDEKKEFISLMLNFKSDCGNCSGTLMMKINSTSTNGFYTSNDGDKAFSLTFSKYNNGIDSNYEDFSNPDDQETKSSNFKISDPDGYSNLRGEDRKVILKKVYEDEIFTIIGRDGNWLKVSMADGTQGYIHESRVVPDKQ